MAVSPESGKYICPRCKKETDDVGDRVRKGTGLVMGHSYCRPCQKEYSAEHYKANRSKIRAKQKERTDGLIKFLSDWKSARGCSECGYNAHPVALAFHHVDESKKSFSLSKVSRSRIGLDKVKAEVEKCIILCANCHRIHHNRERSDVTGKN